MLRWTRNTPQSMFRERLAAIVTPAGLPGFAMLAVSPLAAMAAVAFSIGAVAWIAALKFRLTVLRWAAAQPAIPDVVAR